MVKAPWANQFTGPTQMIPENMPMAPPPRVDQFGINNSVLAMKAMQDMPTMPTGAYRGSPYIIGGVSTPNALAIQAQLARAELQRKWNAGTLVPKGNFNLAPSPGKLSPAEWYAKQYNLIG